MATYEKARHAKAAAIDFLRDIEGSPAFGIAVLGDRDFGVKVNLTRPTDLKLPPTISGGVPLVIEVVGHVKAT